MTVVKGMQTTYGHVAWEPMQVLAGQGGSGGVQTAEGRVVIAAGILSGITALGDGIGDSLTVDGVSCSVVGIGTPPAEDDGDMLALLLKRN